VSRCTVRKTSVCLLLLSSLPSSLPHLHKEQLELHILLLLGLLLRLQCRSFFRLGLDADVVLGLGGDMLHVCLDLLAEGREGGREGERERE